MSLKNYIDGKICNSKLKFEKFEKNHDFRQIITLRNLLIINNIDVTQEDSIAKSIKNLHDNFFINDNCHFCLIGDHETIYTDSGNNIHLFKNIADNKKIKHFSNKPENDVYYENFNKLSNTIKDDMAKINNLGITGLVPDNKNKLIDMLHIVGCIPSYTQEYLYQYGYGVPIKVTLNNSSFIVWMYSLNTKATIVKLDIDIAIDQSKKQKIDQLEKDRKEIVKLAKKNPKDLENLRNKYNTNLKDLYRIGGLSGAIARYFIRLAMTLKELVRVGKELLNAANQLQKNLNTAKNNLEKAKVSLQAYGNNVKKSFVNSGETILSDVQNEGSILACWGKYWYNPSELKNC
jgi:hypothetical protein